jgi:hypothetical protein
VASGPLRDARYGVCAAAAAVKPWGGVAEAGCAAAAPWKRNDVKARTTLAPADRNVTRVMGRMGYA